MERILLLMQAGACADCLRALESARQEAAFPQNLSIGLFLMEEVGIAEQELLNQMGTVRVLCPSDDAWRDMEQLWQGEALVLMGHPGMRFERGWDRDLTRILEACRQQSDYLVALTGFLPRAEDPVEAVSPVAVEGFDPRGRLHLTRGTPLRYAEAPQRSAFLHPDFCFAGAELFRTLADAETPRCIEVLARKWELYTLNEPVIHQLWDDPLPPMSLPADSPETEAFCKRYGIDRENRKVKAAAMEGVWTSDMTFPMKVPVAVRIQEALRNLDNRSSRVDPLVVTCWLKLPDNPDMDRAMLHLRRLGAVKQLALVCFADPESVRRITNVNPNVLEYKARYGLPMTERMQPADMMRYARLSRPFLLAKSREKDLSHTHYIWIDPDYQTYPIYEGAALDWETICTDRIVLARVQGELDLSMMTVPEARLLTLCHEITAVCENAMLRTGRLPKETDLWNGLVHEHPDWFHLIDLPGRRELFSLTMTGRGEEWRTRR